MVYEVLIILVPFVSVVLGIAFWLYFGSKTADKVGVAQEVVKIEDAKTAAEMMLDFLYHGMDGSTRQNRECLDAGCDGHGVMRSSRDITKAVMCAHRAGGRLVLRKKDERDIESSANTMMEVKKVLSEMDIERAKQMRRKYRR